MGIVYKDVATAKMPKDEDENFEELPYIEADKDEEDKVVERIREAIQTNKGFDEIKKITSGEKKDFSEFVQDELNKLKENTAKLNP